MRKTYDYHCIEAECVGETAAAHADLEMRLAELSGALAERLATAETRARRERDGEYVSALPWAPLGTLAMDAAIDALPTDAEVDAARAALEPPPAAPMGPGDSDGTDDDHDGGGPDAAAADRADPARASGGLFATARSPPTCAARFPVGGPPSLTSPGAIGPGGVRWTAVARWPPVRAPRRRSGPRSRRGFGVGPASCTCLPTPRSAKTSATWSPPAAPWRCSPGGAGAGRSS